MSFHLLQVLICLPFVLVILIRRLRNDDDRDE